MGLRKRIGWAIGWTLLVAGMLVVDWGDEESTLMDLLRKRTP